MKIGIVKFSDVAKSGVLSAKYHINKLNNKHPHRLVKNKYVRVDKLNDKEVYLNKKQTFEINNLLYAIAEIKKEIKNIMSDEKSKPNRKSKKRK